MRKQSRFTKAPLSQTEKEKKAEEFLNFTDSIKTTHDDNATKKQERRLKKEAVKAFALRFPLSLSDDIAEISAITGLSMNAVCVELLRPAAKIKLKNLKEE